MPQKTDEGQAARGERSETCEKGEAGEKDETGNVKWSMLNVKLPESELAATEEERAEVFGTGFLLRTRRAPP